MRSQLLLAGGKLSSSFSRGRGSDERGIRRRREKRSCVNEREGRGLWIRGGGGRGRDDALFIYVYLSGLLTLILSYSFLFSRCCRSSQRLLRAQREREGEREEKSECEIERESARAREPNRPLNPNPRLLFLCAPASHCARLKATFHSLQYMYTYTLFLPHVFAVLNVHEGQSAHATSKKSLSLPSPPTYRHSPPPIPCLGIPGAPAFVKFS